MPRIAHARAVRLCARAACFSRAAGSGCSYVLLVMPIGSSTQSRAISANGLPTASVKRELLDQSRAPPEYLKPRQRRALEPHGAQIRRRLTPSRICGIVGSGASGA